MFISYVDNTSFQWHLWAPDLRTTIKAHSIKFAEDIKGGTIDLNLDVQTRNKLPERKPRGRPLRAPIAAPTNTAVPPAEAEAEVQPEVPEVQSEVLYAENPSISNQTQTAEPLPAGPKLAPQRFIYMAIPKRGRDPDTDNDDEDSYRNKISKANIALVLALAAIVDPDGDKENEEIAWAMICAGP